MRSTENGKGRDTCQKRKGRQKRPFRRTRAITTATMAIIPLRERIEFLGATLTCSSEERKPENRGG